MPKKRPPSFKDKGPKGSPYNAHGRGASFDRKLPINTGRDVTVASKSQASDADFTVRLTLPTKDYLDLWVDEVETGFQLQGTTGQAQQYRQFYPRSFAQAHLIVRGQMPNQYEYNRLAQFVRASHAQALTVGALVQDPNHPVNFNQLYRTYKAEGLTPKPTVRLYLRPNLPKRNIDPLRQPWRHKGMLLEGYIPRISAGAERYVVAPRFEFEYVIASSQFTPTLGIYTDTLILGSEIASFLDQIGTPYNHAPKKKRPTKHTKIWGWGHTLGGIFG